MDTATGFFESIRLEDAEIAWIEHLFGSELPGIVPKVGRRKNYRPGVCPLADIGEYILRVLTIHTHFSNHLIHGNFIRNHIESRLASLINEDDGSTTDYLDEKHQALKNITTHLNSLTENCSKIWAQSPSPPPHLHFQFPGPAEHPRIPAYTVNPTSYESTGRSYRAGSSHNSHSSAEYPATGDRSSVLPEVSHEGDQMFSSEQLKSRGTGCYTCPHKEQCKKGGVTADGRVKVFKRNSEFRTHLARHDKQYKCDLPNCPNSEGFARPDQLERHKRDVKHTRLDWIAETPR